MPFFRVLELVVVWDFEWVICQWAIQITWSWHLCYFWHCSLDFFVSVIVKYQDCLWKCHFQLYRSLVYVWDVFSSWLVFLIGSKNHNIFCTSNRCYNTHCWGILICYRWKHSQAINRDFVGYSSDNGRMHIDESNAPFSGPFAVAWDIFPTPVDADSSFFYYLNCLHILQIDIYVQVLQADGGNFEIIYEYPALTHWCLLFFFVFMCFFDLCA